MQLHSTIFKHFKELNSLRFILPKICMQGLCKKNIKTLLYGHPIRIVICVQLSRHCMVF